MRLGLLLSAQHPAGADLSAAVAAHVAQVRAARELGFAAVLAPQHVLSEPYAMLQPVPLLARLAADADGMRLGTGILLLTLLNPVEVAEQVVTLDAIAGGRLILGFGLGYRPVEYAAFDVPASRVRVFHDKLDVLRRLLAGEEVTAEGHGYRLDGVRLALPTSPPRPPLWLAANRDSAVRRAARLGDAWLMNPHATVAQLARQLHLLVTARGGRPAEVPLVRECCVAPTDREAQALARPFLEPKYATYRAWGQDKVMPKGDTLDAEWNELCRDRFLIGAPRTVARQVDALRARVPVTLLVLRVQWPGMAQRHALRSMRLVADSVLPLLSPRAGAGSEAGAPDP